MAQEAGRSVRKKPFTKHGVTQLTRANSQVLANRISAMLLVRLRERVLSQINHGTHSRLSDLSFVVVFITQK